MRAWIAWSIPGLFFLYEFMIRVLPAVIEGPLQKELGVSAGDIGLSMSFYYYAYGPMQIVVGVLLDKLGARGPLSVAALVCGVGALTFAAGTSLTGLGAGRFLMGFGSAFAYVGTVYVATIWFPGRRVAMISGLTVTLGMLGAITAESMLEFLLQKQSWQNVVYGFAAAGVVLAVLLAIMIPNRPQWFKQHMRESTALGEKPSTFACLKQVLSNRQTLLLGVITGLVYLPVGTFAALWGSIACCTSIRRRAASMYRSSSWAWPVVVHCWAGFPIGQAGAGSFSSTAHCSDWCPPPRFC